MSIINKVFFKSNTRFVYMIGDDGAILLYIEQGIVVRRIFAASPDAQHIKAFEDLFDEYPNVPIYAFIDTIDQSYACHSLPPVTALGIGKLVQRRLDRDFSKDDITGAISLGREKEGRRDWNYLLISLTQTEIFKKWLDIVYERENKLVGIYLAPVESEFIVKNIHDKYSQAKGEANSEKKPKKKNKFKKTAKDDEWKILVSHNKIGGFRQVVFKNGRLIFTRLSQTIEGATEEVLAGGIEQEVQNTIEYLKRLSYDPKSILHIYVIIAPEVKDHITNVNLGDNVFFHALSPFEAANLLEIKQAVLSADKYGDIVLATAFSQNKKPILRLTTDYIRKLDKFYLISKLIKSLTVLIGLSLIILSIICTYNWLNTRSNISDLKDKLVRKSSVLSAAKESASKLPADLNDASDLLLIANSLNQPHKSPIDIAKKLQNINSNSIYITDLSWETDANIKVIDINNTSRTKINISINIEATNNANNWNVFVENVEKYFLDIEKEFPNFKVEHDNLDELFAVDQDRKITFEDETGVNNDRKGEVYNIKIKLLYDGSSVANGNGNIQGVTP